MPYSNLLKNQQHRIHWWENEEDGIQRMVRDAMAFLPTLIPLAYYQHDHPLRPFANITFWQGIQKLQDLYGVSTLSAVPDYIEYLKQGRFTVDDLKREVDNSTRLDTNLAIGQTVSQLRLGMLRIPELPCTRSQLHWVSSDIDQLHESTMIHDGERCSSEAKAFFAAHMDQLHDPLSSWCKAIEVSYVRRPMKAWKEREWRFAATALRWILCERAVKSYSSISIPSRLRSHLVEGSNGEIDRIIRQVMTPFCGAFVDPGYAATNLPFRIEGFYESFIKIHCEPMNAGDDWRFDLVNVVRSEMSHNRTSLESIRESFRLWQLGLDEARYFMLDSILVMRGWAGLLFQKEVNPDYFRDDQVPSSMLEFFAVLLLVQRVAIAHCFQRDPLHRMSLANLVKVQRKDSSKDDDRATRQWWLFRISQASPWSISKMASMTSVSWKNLFCEMDAFTDFERKKIYQIAFEEKYKQNLIDALANSDSMNAAKGDGESEQPSFQMVFCADPCEESFRRHIEEIDASVETFGAPGFFDVAIIHQGVDHPMPVPHCPSGVRKSHRTYERQQAAHAKSLLSEWWTRWTSKFRQSKDYLPKRRERLSQAQEPFSESKHAEPAAGFQLDEMVHIVERLLYEIGMTSTFSKIVFVVGHGTSSENNPFEAADNCAFCSGASSEPNATAFAQMANDLRVRESLLKLGIAIPATTQFVAVTHHTGDDSITIPNIASIPASHRAPLEKGTQLFHAASLRNSHERCRRFNSSKTIISEAESFQHVSNRVASGSELQSEFSFLGNAACIVGRRKITKHLFLDRRTFLASYDPNIDPDGTILIRLLSVLLPVFSNVCFNYWFSKVAPEHFGAGSKLALNIQSYMSVVDSPYSDLKCGLPLEMVEGHEPMRLVCVVDSKCKIMEEALSHNALVRRFFEMEWMKLVVTNDGQFWEWSKDGFSSIETGLKTLPEVQNSRAWYDGHSSYLGVARISSAEKTDR